MRRVALLIAVVLTGAVCRPALALTNADVLDKMEQKEQYAYITSVVHTNSYFAYLERNSATSKCIGSYLKKDGAWDRLLAALDHFRDKSPQAVIYTLLKRDCGDPLAGSK